MAVSLDLPVSSSTICVSIIDNGSRISGMQGSDYMAPVLLGHESLDGPSYSFYLYHKPSKSRLLFDLGIRLDWKSAYAPEYVRQLEEWGMRIQVEREITDIVREQHVVPSDIDAIIFSHHHFDHTGDTTKFPSSTKIIVGPGYKDEYLPGYPEDPEETETTSDLYQGREVVELDFSETDPKVCSIGGFQAYDYFADGSFYILSTPGHTLGHLSALARTTSDGQQSTFIFLGGDIVSSNPVFRPSQGYPLPAQVHISDEHHACPGELLAKLHRSYGKNDDKTECYTTPFCEVAGSEDDLAESQRNADKLSCFDGLEDVFVVWAHDMHLHGVLEFFPAEANEWRAKGWKEKGHWRWLEPCVEAMKES